MSYHLEYNTKSLKDCLQQIEEDFEMEDDEALLAPVEDSDEIFEIEDSQDCGFRSSSDLPSNFYQVSNISNFPGCELNFQRANIVLCVTVRELVCWTIDT